MATISENAKYNNKGPYGEKRNSIIRIVVILPNADAVRIPLPA